MVCVQFRLWGSEMLKNFSQMHVWSVCFWIIESNTLVVSQKSVFHQNPDNSNVYGNLETTVLNLLFQTDLSFWLIEIFVSCRVTD